MSRFIETIEFKNGILSNIELHNKRFNKTRMDFYTNIEELDLREFLDTSSLNINSTYKLTISYSETIDKISIIEYHKKIINCLKIVEAEPKFDYSYKYADRSGIERLLSKKENCDDILIIRNNLITDISFANIVFFDGSKYFTPSLPLFKGTKREKLIQEKLLSEEEIRVGDLHLFKYFGIINAMLELGDYRVEIGRIY